MFPDWLLRALLALVRSVEESGRMRSIVTDRLILRPWEEGDADFLFDLESRWETVRYLGADPTPMRSKSEAVASIQRRRAVDHPVHGIWAIARRDSNALAGNLLLKPAHLSAGASGERPVEIGWHLHPSAQSLGFATEAAAGALTDAASRGLASVLAVTDPRNSASHRVCRRLGFAEEGITRSSSSLVFCRGTHPQLPQATPSGSQSAIETVLGRARLGPAKRLSRVDVSQLGNSHSLRQASYCFAPGPRASDEHACSDEPQQPRRS